MRLPGSSGDGPGFEEARPVKSGLRTALLLAAVVMTAATACGPGVYLCACPPNVFPLVVCGTFMNRHGGGLEPAMPLPLSARNRRVAHVPTRSVIPRPAGWGVTNITMDAITISTNCARAPVVTVTPASAGRTLAVARGKNGGIAALILAQTSNATIVVRAYWGHRLIGKVTIPRLVPPAPPPTPSPSPSPTSVPCRKVGHLGGQGPQPFYCLPGSVLPNAGLLGSSRFGEQQPYLALISDDHLVGPSCAGGTIVVLAAGCARPRAGFSRAGADRRDWAGG
jgi:hypothetical protein